MGLVMRGVLLAAIVGLLGIAALLAWRARLPDIEIRYAPKQTTAGRIFPGHALGQGFRCEFDGLHTIEVALAPLGGAEPAGLELVLHVDEPLGPVLRRGTLAASELPRADGWARFEFDALEDSGGREFWFELVSATPSAHAPWVRYRGVPYLIRTWGERVLTEREQTGELLGSPPRPGRPDVLFANLCALAFAVDGLDAAAGPARLELRDAESGELLRRSELAPRAPLASGWAFFAFEPLADSRWRALRYALELPAGSRLVGSDAGHSLIAFHAGGALDTGALGATCRGELLADRDLVFRARSTSGVRALLTRLKARGGGNVSLGALLWLAAVLVLARVSRRVAEPRVS